MCLKEAYSLLRRIGIIKSDDQLPLVHFSEILVEHRSFGMTDMKVATGLRRETSDNLAFFGTLETERKRCRSFVVPSLASLRLCSIHSHHERQ